MITGLDLLLQAGDRLGAIERVAVLVDGDFGVLPFEDAKPWLERMTFFDDASAPDWPEDWVPKGHRYYFQAWTPTRIWYASSEDGVALLKWQAITDDEWMRTASAFEPELIEIGIGRRWKFGRPT